MDRTLMLHPVQSKIRAIGRRVRRLTVMFALGRAALLVLATAVSVALLDFLFRPEDPGVRYLSTLCVAAVLLWTLYRTVLPSLRYRPDDLRIAQHIEAHYPQLRDLLSSAVAFLGQSESSATAGSFDLRRAVVAQMEGQLDQIDMDRCVDSRRSTQTAWMTVIAVVAVAAACVFAPRTSLLAASRLLMPWSEQPWPRRHVLEFVNPPLRLAAGSDFEAAVVDSRGLPENVQIHYWFEGEPARSVQTKEMTFFGDRMIHRLDNVTRSFRYRATGGDDNNMPWQDMQVVEPPRVETVQLRIHPPAYTGWPASDSGENIHALAGSQIEVQGALNRAVSRLTLKTECNGTVEERAAEVSEDGHEFRLRAGGENAWTLTESGVYWFEVTDLDGLTGGDGLRWNLHVIPDSPPAVTLERPGVNTFVTADAAVPLTGLVKEDLALHRIELVYRMGSHEGATEQVIEIFRGPDAADGTAGEPWSSDARDGISQPIEFAWDLAPLDQLKPGDWLEFKIVASDYRPQSGDGSPRRLSIISVEELEERIAARQSFILSQLAEILRLQQDARSQTRSIEIQWDEAKRLERRDIDQLQGADLNQRQVARRLADPQEGVASQITALLHELESNRVDSPEVFRRMNELLDAIHDISRQRLPAIQRSLVNAAKIARTQTENDASPEAKSLRTALGDAGTGQDDVIQILEDLLGELSQWDSYRRFAREIGRIRQIQEEILESTGQTRLETLGQTLSELSPQQRSDLKRLSERQLEAARQFDKIQSRMETMAEALRNDDPVAAQTLTDALNEARRTAVGGQMRESGRQVEQNQVGQAAEVQEQILEDLRDLMDTLSNRRGHELQRRLRKLNEAAGELGSLLDQQKELRARLQQAAAQPDSPDKQRELMRLVREQRKLAEQSEELGRRLERLQAQRTAETLRKAAGHQQQSADAAEGNEPQSALEQAEQAERTLEEAQRQLEEQRRQTEQDLLNEQNARLKQEIEGLLGRQQTILDTTVEIDGQRTAQGGSLTPGQQQTVHDWAQQQRTLAEQTGQYAEKLERSLAFGLGLRGAVREMDRAAVGLEADETGSSTQQAQQAAIRRLQQMVEALKRDSQPGEPSEDSPPPGGEDQSPPTGEDIQRLAELKLLKLMQEEINLRTRQIEQQQPEKGGLSDVQARDLDNLAREQGQLADLLFDLTQELGNNPENEPDDLPDIRGEKVPGLDDFDRLLEQESQPSQQDENP